MLFYLEQIYHPSRNFSTFLHHISIYYHVSKFGAILQRYNQSQYRYAVKKFVLKIRVYHVKVISSGVKQQQHPINVCFDERRYNFPFRRFSRSQYLQLFRTRPLSFKSNNTNQREARTRIYTSRMCPCVGVCVDISRLEINQL